MTERQIERLDIIKQLIGSIESTGETHIDDIVVANLDFAEKVIFDLVGQLVINAKYTGYEQSRIDISSKSQSIITEILELICSGQN